MHDLNDTILAQYIKDGCEKSFKEFYDRYHVQLYYIAKQYLKDPALAEDAVHDIFVKFWVNRSGIDPMKSVRSFIFTMLKNHLLNVLRKKREIIISYEGVNEDLLPRKNVTEDEIIYKEYQDTVNRGLRELSDRKREVFELKTFKGHTNSEIAKLLKINIRTVKTHYYNSSKFIRKYLRDHAGFLGLLFIFSLIAIL